MSYLKNQCSLCKTTQAIFYKLDGRKCKDEDFQQKLLHFVGHEYNAVLANMVKESSCVCRTCFANVMKMEERRKMFENNIKLFVSKPVGPCMAGDACDHTYHSQDPFKLLVRITVRHQCLTDTFSNSRNMHVFSIPHRNEETKETNCNLPNEADTEHTYSKRKEEDVSQPFCQRISTGIAERKEVTEEEFDDVISQMQDVKTSECAEKFFKLPVVMEIVKKNILEELKWKCSELASKKKGTGSILIQKKSVDNLSNIGDVLAEILLEMKNRLPFLLQVFEIISRKNEIIPLKYGPLCAAYAILMFAREPELSLLQRLTTVICIRGHIEDMALSRLNRLGITMSTTSKIRLLDECGDINTKGLADYLKTKPLLKITGDKLDIYVKTLKSTNKDLHMFATNAISCRIASTNMSTRPNEIKDAITPEDILIDDSKREILRESYIILLSRILENLKEFAWVKSVTPKHIPHPYQREMAKKSQVFQMPLLMQNEAKYEECIKIMTSYEKLVIDSYTKAHGSSDALKKFPVIVGGDQLTRVRLEGAKNLRLQAPTPESRFEHLNPIICEMWHMKQDFLEKLYKQLYQDSTKRQVGTLSFYKSVLRKSDVNGKVKSNFQAHANLLTIIVKNLIVEQFLSFFGMENENEKPTDNIFPDNINVATTETKRRCLREMFSKFFDRYGYLSVVYPLESNDDVMNYCNHLCIWGLHFLELEDTSSEGDITRIIPNLAHNIPFFYSHSCLSKYLVECVDYILKTEYLSSQLDRMRILEGSFVNTKGGAGNNIEADLVQEHHIRHQKELIRNLGANKSDEAMIRATSASNVIAKIISNFDVSNTVVVKSSRHTKVICTEDDNFIKTSLRDLKPFTFVPGRKMEGIKKKYLTPFCTIDKNLFNRSVQTIINRIIRGYPIADVEEDSDED